MRRLRPLLVAACASCACGDVWAPAPMAAPLATVRVRWRALAGDEAPRLALVWFGTTAPIVALEAHPQPERPLELLALVREAPPDQAFVRSEAHADVELARGALVAFVDGDGDGVLAVGDGPAPDRVVANALALPRAPLAERLLVVPRGALVEAGLPRGLSPQRLDGGLAPDEPLTLDADPCVDHGWFARRAVVTQPTSALVGPPLRSEPCAP